MRDVNLPVRTAFFQLLNEQLEYESSNVPISDERSRILNNSTLYVILSSQNTVDNSGKCDYTRTAYITLDIVNKTESAVSKAAIDYIADQILQKVFGTGLTTPLNWQFLNIKLNDDRYISLQLSDTSHIVRRLLTFQLTVVQN